MSMCLCGLWVEVSRTSSLSISPRLPNRMATVKVTDDLNRPSVLALPYVHLSVLTPSLTPSSKRSPPAWKHFPSLSPRPLALEVKDPELVYHDAKKLILHALGLFGAWPQVLWAEFNKIVQRKMLIKEQSCRLPFTSFRIGCRETHFGCNCPTPNHSDFAEKRGPALMWHHGCCLLLSLMDSSVLKADRKTFYSIFLGHLEWLMLMGPCRA